MPKSQTGVKCAHSYMEMTNEAEMSVSSDIGNNALGGGGAC